MTVLNENPMNLTDLAALIPPARAGKKVLPGTLKSWAIRGVKTPHGIVRLEAVKLAGRWLSSWAALQRFAEAQSPAANTLPLPRSATERQRAIAKAERDLERLGA